MSLFFAPQTVSGRPVLVQFRAGTMTIADGTATADKRKGFASLIQNTSGLLEMWWQPADSTQGGAASANVQTIITFGDATFDKVDKCTTGTVFALCLNGSKEPSHTRLFWLQEANTREADILAKVKRLVGDAECRKRLQAAAGSGGARPPGATAGSSSAATATGASAASAPAASSGAKGPITNEALQAILQNLSSRARPVDINLQQMLGSDEVLSALREDPAFYMSRVGDHLPPNHSNDIVAEIRNPQASAAAATLQAAVSESPNTLNEVLTAFGLPKPSAATPAAGSGPATALCEAIVKESENKAASPAAGNNAADGDSAPSPATDKSANRSAGRPSSMGINHILLIFYFSTLPL